MSSLLTFGTMGVPGTQTDPFTRLSQSGVQFGTILHEINNPTPGLAPGTMVRNLAKVPSRFNTWGIYQGMRREATSAYNTSEARRVTAENQAKRAREQDRRGAGISGNLGGGARRGNVLIGLLGLLGDANNAKRTLGGAR